MGSMKSRSSSPGQKTTACKTWMGQIPPAAKGWRPIATCFDQDESAWAVFLQDQEHSPVWKNVKVVALGRVERKANYWVAFNIETGQMGFARDYALMRANRPQLHGQVEKIRHRLGTT